MIRTFLGEIGPIRRMNVGFGLLCWFFLCAAPCPVQSVPLSLNYDAVGNLTSVQPASAGPLSIVTQPAHQALIVGQSTSFSVIATSGLAVTYQWRLNGQPISGATGDTLSFPIMALDDAGEYTVTVSNGTQTVTSRPALLFTDSDFDELPDVWEQTSFGNLTEAGGGDFDGDGLSNVNEFLRGADPTVPDVLPLPEEFSITETTGSSIKLSLLSQIGVIYQLQGSMSLESGQWSDVGPSRLGTNNHMQFYPSVQGSKMFFRVEVMWAP